MKLYRAMSKREKELLETRGFSATFSKGGWKWFATSPDYVFMVVNEFNYGMCPELKYTEIVEFEIDFDSAMPQSLVKKKMERGYLNIAIDGRALAWIKSVKWRLIDKSELPAVEPKLMWISQSGRIVEIYSIKKALELISQFGKRGFERIVHISCDLGEKLNTRCCYG